MSGLNLLISCLLVAGIIWWAAAVEKAEERGDETKKYKGFFAVKDAEAPKARKASGKDKTAELFNSDYLRRD